MQAEEKIEEEEVGEGEEGAGLGPEPLWMGLAGPTRRLLIGSRLRQRNSSPRRIRDSKMPGQLL